MITKKIKEKNIKGEIIFTAVEFILITSFLLFCSGSKEKQDSMALATLVLKETTQSQVESELTDSFNGDNTDLKRGNKCNGNKYKLPDPACRHITITGINALDVKAKVRGGGFIKIVNNGGHIASNVSGKGKIRLVNNGLSVTVRENGNGIINIVNNGNLLSATNTGKGLMTIYNTATAPVTIVNTGNGLVTVTTTGSIPLFITHTGDEDFTYPPLPHITITGRNALDVAPALSGGGFINVENDGGFVAVTETGTGRIHLVNHGAALTATATGKGMMNILNNGKVLTATNTGNGVLTVNNTCTAAVIVTNTGNGRVTVTFSGSTPITFTHTGDEDFAYP
ncbi:MAG TPA: pilin [Leptospiraceae bacterium]|nr:pilin [Leptospiraceae bacterium]HRG76874.1 pilin [Leptospiraceae bacterium]